MGFGQVRISSHDLLPPVSTWLASSFPSCTPVTPFIRVAFPGYPIEHRTSTLTPDSSSIISLLWFLLSIYHLTCHIPTYLYFLYTLFRINILRQEYLFASLLNPQLLGRLAES